MVILFLKYRMLLTNGIQWDDDILPVKDFAEANGDEFYEYFECDVSFRCITPEGNLSVKESDFIVRSKNSRYGEFYYTISPDMLQNMFYITTMN